MSQPKPPYQTEKPKRLYFETYMQMIQNAIGSKQFRNFYVWTSERGKFDALADGDLSCAFFVSCLLVIFKKLAAVHGTVTSTVADLKRSGWAEVEQPEPGDVVVWAAQEFPGGTYQHVGFYIGNGRAISTSWQERVPVEHDLHFGETKRAIEQIFRMGTWD